jgi:hypothetical protein
MRYLESLEARLTKTEIQLKLQKVRASQEAWLAAKLEELIRKPAKRST